MKLKKILKKTLPALIALSLTSGCAIVEKVKNDRYVAPLYDGIFCAKSTESISKNGKEVFAAKYKDKDMYEKRKGFLGFMQPPYNELTYGWEIILKDDKGFHRLTNNIQEEYHPQIDPKGNYIVFERTIYKEYDEKRKEKKKVIKTDLYKLDLKTKEETRLTDNGKSRTPFISPNGRLIAFTYGGNIWVMESDGSNPKPILDTPQNVKIYDWTEEGLRYSYGDKITHYKLLN